MRRSAENYEDILLEGWESVYRKSQLSLLILLALKDGSKHVGQIKQFIADATQGRQSTDEQSMYRTLRRFKDADMVVYVEIESDGGPKKKLYSLTELGTAILRRFLHRNIIDFLYRPHIRQLVERV
jgi:DNA-binding PadR family transcriptional regulator